MLHWGWIVARLLITAIDDDELEKLVLKESKYEDGSAADKWMAKLFEANYQGIAMCCFDPYRDEAREVLRCAACRKHEISAQLNVI